MVILLLCRPLFPSGSAWRIGHCHPYGAGICRGLLQHGGPGLGNVQVGQARQARVITQGGVLEDQVSQGPVAAGHHIFEGGRAEHLRGLLRHGRHQGIRLVGTAAGKPLLGLAASRRAGLDVPGAGLGREEGAFACHPDAVSAPPHQQQSQAAWL